MAEQKDFYQQIKDKWPQITKPFECSSTGRSIWQVANTLIPFFALMALMYWSIEVSLWLTFALSVLTAGFWLRIFVLFHDCCHGSFFKSKRANALLGFWLGVLVMTPYSFWRKSHAIHHANSGNLEQRGIGDINTLTVQEYLSLSAWKKLAYRIYRNPFVQFVLGPLLFFALNYRFSRSYSKTWKRERRSIYLTNICLVASIWGLIAWLGLSNVLLMLLPAFTITTGFGVWLFYIQHQFDHTYWSHQQDWDYVKAALKGSSFYKLPRWLHWFTANIGFHHVHHLNPRIPNYRLPACHKANEIFQKSPTLTFWKSLRLMFLTLWDENQKKMISFRQLKAIRGSS